LLEVALIVPLPVKLFRLTFTGKAPSLTIDNDVGSVDSEHTTGEGFGLGLGETPGLGLTPGDGFGDTCGLGFGETPGLGFTEGEGAGDWPGEGLGEAPGDGELCGDAPGSGITPPPPVTVTGGIEVSRKISRSNVTSPDPETFMFTVGGEAFGLRNPNDSSPAMRPRQSNEIDFTPVVNWTPCSRSKFRVVKFPKPSQSMVTE
jgi:hypothetical protein